VAFAAAWLGYAASEAAAAVTAVRTLAQPYRNWGERRLGPVVVRVPDGWGDVETEDGGEIVHNKARRFRIEGDAAWYSSAVELRVRAKGARALMAEGPMTEMQRTLRTAAGDIVVAAAVANGVSPKQRRIVGKVLDSARAL
jgi:hypothetical protein